MRMRAYDSIMNEIKKAEKDFIRDPELLLGLYGELNKNMEYFKRVSTEKIKQKLKGENLTYKEYAAYKDLLSEKKKYSRNEFNIKNKYAYYADKMKEYHWGKAKQQEVKPKVSLKEKIKNSMFECTRDSSYYFFCDHIILDTKTSDIMGNAFKGLVNEYFVEENGIMKLKTSKKLIPIIFDSNNKEYKNTFTNKCETRYERIYKELISGKELEQHNWGYKYNLGQYDNEIIFCVPTISDYDGFTIVYASEKDVERVLNSLTSSDISEYKTRMNEFMLAAKNILIKRIREIEEQWKKNALDELCTKRKIYELKKKLK